MEQQVAELQAIRNDYEEIVEHATEVIFKLDKFGNFYFVSAQFQRMLDISNEEMKGKHFTTIVHPEDLHICVETFKMLELYGKASSSIDFRVRTRGGSYKWVNCSAVCLFDKSGEPSHTIGLAHEVTMLHALLDDLRTSEMALKISEERYRSLFEALGEGVVLIDSSGAIIASNRCAEKLFDMDRENLANIHTSDREYVFLRDDGSRFPVEEHPGTVTLRSGQPLKDVVMGVGRKNSDIKWISVNTEPIYYTDNRDKPDAVVASCIDITQARKDKELLLLNQQLLQQESRRYIKATRALAEAVVDAQEKERADIGFELHDNVNQVLTTARLYLDLAVMNADDRVNLIKRSAESLAHAVSEIRKISHSLVPATLNDIGLVASVDDLLEGVRITQQLHIEFYHKGEIEQISEKRKLVLFRIIQEQVTNVLKHADASKLFIELIADNCLLSLTISDNGRGFDKNNIKKGVGLHNIANRAELFNGKVNIIAAPGKGCKLNIQIPI